MNKRNGFVGLRLWRLGFPVSEDYWRPQLRRFGRSTDWVFPFINRLVFRFDRKLGGRNIARAVARHPANNIIVSRIKGRLVGEDLAIFYRVLLETGLGEFERFDPGDETRSRDEAAAIKALDIGNSEKHEILGKKLNLIDVLPSALNNAAIAFSMGNFAQAADAPAEEIAKACDDARNALQIGLWYEAHKWIYGTEAFGLRLAAWVARKAPDAVVDGLILLVMRFGRFQTLSCLPSKLPRWRKKPWPYGRSRNSSNGCGGTMRVTNRSSIRSGYAPLLPIT
jgi:NAD(P)-dependent dehydrogenase (short-subunit alcohol dehydrogenase family)